MATAKESQTAGKMPEKKRLARKEMKAAAKKVLKKHYGLYVLLCMVVSLLGGKLAFSGNMWENTSVEASVQNHIVFPEDIVMSFAEFVVDIQNGDWEGRKRKIDEAEERYAEGNGEEEEGIFGRSEGLFALIANKLSSGSYLMTLFLGIRSLVGTDSGAVAILLLGALFLLFFIQIFIVGVYRTAVLRVFLEGRLFEKTPMHRVWFLLRVRKWFHVGMVQFLTSVFSALWSLTIVGGIIKYYSYYLVPSILAENPSIKAKDAISLSVRLMKGHKWECFVLDISFFGWELLGIATMGISDVLFNTPYKAAVLAEYYVRLRGLGKEEKLEGTELLNDSCLFEKTDMSVLWQAYGDVEEEYGQMAADAPMLKGMDKVLAEVFGLSLRRNKELEIMEAGQSCRFQLEEDRRALEGKVYPARLHPISEKQQTKWLASLNYLRYYSVWSIIMMFFVLSFSGWVWEVCLHLVTDGELVNRGVLHGPWLPIYGCGSVLILLLLYSFRKKPVMEFILAVLLCGCVEYFTSLYLEIVNDGTRWWDYTGYFLNLNGRICAEGLLVFGIGGMAIVYVLAPFLDGLFRKMPEKILIAAAVVLLLVFGADQIYSMKHPNQGKGITSGEVSGMEEGRTDIRQSRRPAHRAAYSKAVRVW